MRLLSFGGTDSFWGEDFVSTEKGWAIQIMGMGWIWKCFSLVSRSGKKIGFSFYMFDIKVEIQKPFCRSDQLKIWNLFLFEWQHFRECWLVHFNQKFMTNEVELKFLNTTFDCKKFFEIGIIMFFCLSEWSTFVSTYTPFSVFFFQENGCLV